MPGEIERDVARRRRAIGGDQAQLAVRKIQDPFAVAAPARRVGHLFVDRSGFAGGKAIGVDRAGPQVAVHDEGHVRAVGRIDGSIDAAGADGFVRSGFHEGDFAGGEVDGFDEVRAFAVAPRVGPQRPPARGPCCGPTSSASPGFVSWAMASLICRREIDDDRWRHPGSGRRVGCRRATTPDGVPRRRLAGEAAARRGWRGRGCRCAPCRPCRDDRRSACHPATRPATACRRRRW